jgi:hypothetical protein
VVDRAGDDEHHLHAAFRRPATSVPIIFRPGTKYGLVMWMEAAPRPARAGTWCTSPCCRPGELRTTWASTSPFESRLPARKVLGLPIATPVALEPVLGERALQLLDDRPFQEDVGVAPVSFLASVPAHFPLMPEPPVTPDHTVHDQDPTVVSVITRSIVNGLSGR